MNQKQFRSLLWRGLLILVIALSACTYPTPMPSTSTPGTETTEPPTPETTATPEGELTPIDLDPGGLALSCRQNLALLQRPLETTPFFVKDQVILTGPSQAVSQTVAELKNQDPEINLDPIMECAVVLPPPAQIMDTYERGLPFKKNNSGDQRPPSSPYYPPGRPGDDAKEIELTTNLYVVRSTVDFNTVFQVFNDLKTKEREELADVYLDANYLTGTLASSQCSNPTGSEGKPFGVEGSPFGVEGSPFGVEGSTGGGKTDIEDPALTSLLPALFDEQWAFRQIGVPPPPASLEYPEGEGVLVGVFDTSPYTLTSGAIISTTVEPVSAPRMALTVHHLLELPGLAASSTITSPVVVQDHGLFVSSLVYAVEPASEIHLYRVLNEWGCGTLYHLNISMLDFISNDWDRDQGNLKQPAVINQSLGIQRPRDLPPGMDPRRDLSEFDEEIIQAYELLALDESIESLQTFVHLAFQTGIVVVAAGGNDSINTKPHLPNMALGMQLPAWYSFVIGVSASNPADAGSCYSNQGDVAAPGGEAAPDTSNGKTFCRPMTIECPEIDKLGGGPSLCEFGLVGLTRESPSGYSYWVGTSFATPLVAGFAAQLYGKNPGNPGLVYQSVTTEVDGISDSQFGLGRIKVP